MLDEEEHAYHVLLAIFAFGPDATLPLLGVPLAAHLLKLGGAHLSVALEHPLAAHQQPPAAAIAGHIQHLRNPLWQRHQLHSLQAPHISHGAPALACVRSVSAACDALCRVHAQLCCFLSASSSRTRHWA